MQKSPRMFESAKIAAEYFKFRPKYSNDVRDAVMKYLNPHWNGSSRHDLMVEVGCGSGQVTSLMAPYFKQILASDVSRQQIEFAKRQNQFANVSYGIGSAENLSLIDNSSVDVVLAMACAHWLDLPRFFDETARILKPDGCLAIGGYWFPTLVPLMEGKENLTAQVSDLLEHHIVHGKRHDLIRYAQVKTQYPDVYEAIPWIKKEKQNVQLAYEDWTLETAKGFIRSMDSYQQHLQHIFDLRKNKIAPQIRSDLDSAEEFSNRAKKLLEVTTAVDDKVKFRAVFDVFLLLAKVV